MGAVHILGLATLDHAGFALLAEVSLKGALLMLTAGIVVFSWKGASAAQRHLVWAIALGMLLILPVFAAAGLRWQIPLEGFPRAARMEALPPAESAGPLAMVRSDSPAEVATTAGPVGALPWKGAVLTLWLVGAVLLLGRLLGAVAHVRRMVHRAHPVHGGPGAEVVAALARGLGMPDPPRLLQAAGDGVPLACGISRPLVLLPEAVGEWPRERVELVLLHELSHIRRRDILVQLVSEVACALHWFNPLAWLALRRLRLESERACDDAVLQAGIRASTYAEELVAFARHLRGRRGLVLPTTPMAEPSQLPSRIRALLEAERDRRGVSARVVATALAAGVVLCALVAAAAPAAGATPRLTDVGPSGPPPHAAQGGSGAGASPAAPLGQPLGVPAGLPAPAGIAPAADTTLPVLLNLAEVNRRVAEEYPQRLKEAGVSGITLLELQIDSLGRVVDTRVVHQSDPAFGEAASRSLGTARFAPARAEGAAVASRVQWPVAFNAISALASGSGTAAEQDAAQLLRASRVAAGESASVARIAAILARRSAVVEQQSGVVSARSSRVAEQTATLRAALSALAAARDRPLLGRVSDEVLGAAVARFHPTVRDQGLPEGQYVWFVATPEGEVRHTGVAESRRRNELSAHEAEALLVSRSIPMTMESMQLSRLPSARPGERGTLVAWIVARESEPE